MLLKVLFKMIKSVKQKWHNKKRSETLRLRTLRKEHVFIKRQIQLYEKRLVENTSEIKEVEKNPSARYRKITKKKRLFSPKIAASKRQRRMNKRKDKKAVPVDLNDKARSRMEAILERFRSGLSSSSSDGGKSHHSSYSATSFEVSSAENAQKKAEDTIFGVAQSLTLSDLCDNKKEKPTKIAADKSNAITTNLDKSAKNKNADNNSKPNTPKLESKLKRKFETKLESKLESKLETKLESESESESKLETKLTSKQPETDKTESTLKEANIESKPVLDTFPTSTIPTKTDSNNNLLNIPTIPMNNIPINISANNISTNNDLTNLPKPTLQTDTKTGPKTVFSFPKPIETGKIGSNVKPNENPNAFGKNTKYKTSLFESGLDPLVENQNNSNFGSINNSLNKTNVDLLNKSISNPLNLPTNNPLNSLKPNPNNGPRKTFSFGNPIQPPPKVAYPNRFVTGNAHKRSRPGQTQTNMANTQSGGSYHGGDDKFVNPFSSKIVEMPMRNPFGENPAVDISVHSSNPILRALALRREKEKAEKNNQNMAQNMAQNPQNNPNGNFQFGNAQNAQNVQNSGFQFGSGQNGNPQGGNANPGDASNENNGQDNSGSTDGSNNRGRKYFRARRKFNRQN